MSEQTIIEVIQAIGLPTALSIYLLVLNNKNVEKYELLVDKITGEINKLNDKIEDNQQAK